MKIMKYFPILLIITIGLLGLTIYLGATGKFYGSMVAGIFFIAFIYITNLAYGIDKDRDKIKRARANSYSY